MKNKIIYIVSIFLLTIVSIYTILPNEVEAATLTVTPSKTITVGETKSITIGSGVTGRVDITSSDPSVASVSSSTLWIENGSTNINITAKKEGSATITVIAKSLASSDDGSKVEGSKTCSVTVKAKEPVQPTQPQPEQTPQKPTQTTTNNNKTTTKKTENKKTETPIVETKEKEEASSEFGIHSLKLIGVKENKEEVEIALDRAFNIKTFEYTCNIANDIKTIRIEKEAYEYNDLVQISGLEEELKVGENNVTLKLAKDGKEVSYQIKITKEEAKNEETEATNAIVEQPQQKETMMVSMPLVWFILLEIVIVALSVGITIVVMNYLKKNPYQKKDKKQKKEKDEEKEFKKI